MSVIKEEKIYGVVCKVDRIKCMDGRYRDRYTFTVPRWEECTVIGKANAKRVIDGRTKPGVWELYHNKTV